MNELKTGGPAFPRAPFEFVDNSTGLNWAVTEQGGMTLRDYFAAKAMQGLLQHTAESTHQLASESYDIADAMLKAREK